MADPILLLSSRRHAQDGSPRRRQSLVAVLAGLVLLAAGPGAWSSQASGDESRVSEGSDGSQAGARSVRVAASERYRAGRIFRFALGGGYRDLWQAEVDLPLLDLAAEAGGLTPTRRFGGLQTAVLGFSGADGQSYTFRGTDKDPSAVLDSLLRDTVVQTIIQDQMAAQHPAGPPVASVLSEAAGVLTIHERSVVMPDDPRLGEFREEFAGMVGTFYRYPQATAAGREGFHSAREILDNKAFYAALERDDDVQVDVEAFLRARLFDLFLGDFDRHRKQWRWAELPGEPRLQPIPEDRDMAFVRFNGFGPRLMKIYIPILQRYDAQYPSMLGLTMHGWEQDRWLLPALSWSVWERIARDMQARLDDAAIERALAQLPPEYAAIDADRLRADVRGRRDNLLEGARAYYEHLAGHVDLRTSDAAHRIDVTRSADGSLRVEVRPDARDAGAEPLFARTFLPKETKEVRIYLGEGDDRIVVRGKPGCIRLRLISEGGAKQLDDSAGGGTRVYDALDSVEVVRGRGTRLDSRGYTPPPPDSGFVDVEDVPPRDWGSQTIPIPEFGFQPDVGVFLGAALAHTRYGFRKDPWSSKHSFALGWAFEASEPRARYQGRFRPENSRLVGILDLQYSAIEVLRFYGFGNESSDRNNDRFFRVRNDQVHVSPRLARSFFDDRIGVSGGPYLLWSRTRNGARAIDQGDIYGTGRFGTIGAELNFRFDTRESISTEHADLELPFHDNPAAGYPTSGMLFDVTGRISPPVWGVDGTYGYIEGSVSGYLSLGEDARATLGVRVGGKETFGPTPYFDVAYIGGGRFFTGSATNRGFRTRRFAGDSAVFGNVDLRVVLARLKILVPGDLGVHGFFDVGRVFLNDQNSDDWHPSGGGGIWFSPLVRTNTVSLSVAGGPEETLFYLRFGFLY